MEANELRIGNYLHDREDNLCSVIEFNLYAPAISGAVTKLPNKPIDLNEDWLLKLGFEWDIPTGKYCNGNWCIRLKHDGTIDISHIKSHSNFLPLGVGFSIRYVHQLQNIYYSLNGEELRITKQ